MQASRASRRGISDSPPQRHLSISYLAKRLLTGKAGRRAIDLARRDVPGDSLRSDMTTDEADRTTHQAKSHAGKGDATSEEGFDLAQSGALAPFSSTTDPTRSAVADAGPAISPIGSRWSVDGKSLRIPTTA
jgi:hypothetical protein